MDTENIRRIIFPYGKKTAIKRGVVALGCAAIILLSDFFVQTVVPLQPIHKPMNQFMAVAAAVNSPVAKPTPTASVAKPTPTSPVATSTPTPPAAKPTPTAPAATSTPTSPVATPTPILPGVVQEQARLAAQGRFLYRGSPALPEIALTFDDGPNPPYTSQILAILNRYKIHATFFCVGRQVQAYPDLVRQEVKEGNSVGNHTWSHPNLPTLSGPSILGQMTTTSDAITSATGLRPVYFRPPYGAVNGQVLTDIDKLGLSAVLWDVDPGDWSMPGVDVITARLHAQVKNGSIILMHDGGGDRSQTVAALPGIIEWYQQRGFRFVTLPQLIADLYPNAAPKH